LLFILYSFVIVNLNQMELIIATIASLLPIINPFSTAPMFLAMTQGDTEQYRNLQAKKGVLYMIIILLVSLIAGTFIMNFFGLSLPGMRIAGGILISRVAMNMLNPSQNDGRTKEEEKEANEKKDISFTPLAMPSLSGPGAISVIIGMSSIADSVFDYIFIAIGVLVVAVAVFVTLRSASRLVKYLGATGLTAMTKIMGFIILCVGIQFIVNGILGIATSNDILKFIQQATQ
jgi:multiple antibiotic resistance protein